MAKKLKSFEFSGRGRSQKYPWDEWLDGSIWKLARGKDFTCSAEVMRSQCHNAATRRGKAIRVHCDGDVIVIQAFDVDE